MWYYRHEFLAAICGWALSMSKGKEMSGICLAASQCPHWSPQGCLMSRCSSNGRGKIAWVQALWLQFCHLLHLWELGFLARETSNPRKRLLKMHWEPNWTAKVKGEGRAKVHRVFCLCKFGSLHLHSYEQSIIRKLLLKSRQVLAPF